MELTNEKVIRAPRDRVYTALHDPKILRQAIPGLQSLNRLSADQFELTVALKVGPLKSTFHGSVRVLNEDPPRGYSLMGSAGAAAGGAEGSAHVALVSVGGSSTNLAFQVTADLSGPLARLEPALIERTARLLGAEFFSRLEQMIEDEPATVWIRPANDVDDLGPPPNVVETAPLGAAVVALDPPRRWLTEEDWAALDDDDDGGDDDPVDRDRDRDRDHDRAHGGASRGRQEAGGADVYQLPGYEPSDYVPTDAPRTAPTVLAADDGTPPRPGAAFGAMDEEEPASVGRLLWRALMVVVGLALIYLLLIGAV